MVTDRDAGSTSSHSDFSFRVLPVPAPGGIASPRSVVPKAQPACRSSHQNTSLSLLRRCGARGRAPSRSGPSPPSVPYFDAHAWQARAAAGPDAGEGSRPRDPSFPEPSPLVDPVIRIRP
jgi:hypothetical protein